MRLCRAGQEESKGEAPILRRSSCANSSRRGGAIFSPANQDQGNGGGRVRIAFDVAADRMIEGSGHLSDRVDRVIGRVHGVAIQLLDIPFGLPHFPWTRVFASSVARPKPASIFPARLLAAPLMRVSSLRFSDVRLLNRQPLNEVFVPLRHRWDEGRPGNSGIRKGARPMWRGPLDPRQASSESRPARARFLLPEASAIRVRHPIPLSEVESFQLVPAAS